MKAAIACGIAALLLAAQPLAAAEAPAAAEAAVSSTEIRQGKRMLRQAEEHLALEEGEAAVALYEKLIQRFSEHALGFTAHLHLARYRYQQGEYESALEHFSRAAARGAGPAAISNPDLAERSEALFHVGMCFVQSGQPNRCFPAFRQVIEIAPGSELANRAYFQIAEAHYVGGNYTQALANYRMVGTSLDQAQQASLLAELGKPLSLRLEDRDLLVLAGAPITVELTTSDGDRETLELEPQLPGSEVYVGELSTGLGAPRPGDGVIQGHGQSELEVHYRDRHTADGTLDLPRSQRLRFVADASVAFTDGAFRDPVSGVALDEGRGTLDLRVLDPDRDSGAAVDRIEVELVVERPLPPPEPEPGAVVTAVEQEPRWEERARQRLELVETLLQRRSTIELGSLEEAPEGDRPQFRTEAIDAGLRSGSFVAEIPFGEGSALPAAIGDRLILRYRDQRHLGGEQPLLREHVVTVVPGTVSTLMMAGYHLGDANLKVRKELLQAETSLRIGEVYRDMGLEVHAQRRFDEALNECRRVGATDGVYDRELREQTLYTLWRVFLAKGDLGAAAKACRSLQLEFPQSDFIDDSLLSLGRAAALAGESAQAIQLFRQVASLPGGSPLAAEALFAVGEVHARQSERVENGVIRIDSGARQRAIGAWREVFTTYPDSAYAIDALKQTGDFYFKERNYAQAIDFFETILRDYPDAPFIADVLFNLARSQVLKPDYPRALALIERIEREHPGFERMDTVRKLRAFIDRKQSGRGGEE